MVMWRTAVIFIMNVARFGFMLILFATYGINAIWSSLYYQQEIFNNHKYTTKLIREAIYTQWVNHFNTNDHATFDQVISINEEFYEVGGPVFIYIAGHYQNIGYWLEETYVREIAEQQHGIIYGIQPRFYGNSRPTADLSLENLKLLTIQQTIADIVDFTRFLRNALAQFGSDKFILYGVHTGATLATYAHQLYPGVFDGVWAVAGPLNAIFNFATYFHDINMSVFNFFGPDCGSVIWNGLRELEQYVQNGEDDKIVEILKLNQSIDLSDENQINVMYYIISQVVADYLEFGTAQDINTFCLTVNRSIEKGTSNLEAFAPHLQYKTSVVNFDWNIMIENLKETAWSSVAGLNGERAYWYSACTQWSWFQTSYGLPDPLTFRFREDFFVRICTEVFGLSEADVIAGNSQTLQDFQLDWNLERIFFTNGEFDPFRFLSPSFDLNAGARGRLIPGYGKAFELIGYGHRDDYFTEEMVDARNDVRETILRWIEN